jgi:uncharacterized protein (DUF2062 family)
MNKKSYFSSNCNGKNSQLSVESAAYFYYNKIMPRKFFKRISPAKQELMDNRWLKLFSDFAHKAHVWHISRRSVSRAVMIGVFCAFIPLPIQMFLAIGFCIWIRANLPISVFIVWLTNPLTMAPIFYATYLFGAFMLDVEPINFEFQMSWQWLEDRFYLVWKPLLLGSLTTGIFCAAVGYTAVDLLWRRHAIKRWQNRHRKT